MKTHFDRVPIKNSPFPINVASQAKGTIQGISFFQNNRSSLFAAQTHRAEADASPQVSRSKSYAKMAADNPQAKRTAQLRLMAEASAARQGQPIQGRTSPEQGPRGNKAGLPANLKSGTEILSGYSLDDVKVHYNSAKPAQLQAHAYAQGTDIHLGPGQEKHLPHELWHVVQQKQGRVKPTRQLKGDGNVKVNDEVTLEKEADVMGGKALAMGKSNARSQYAPVLKPGLQSTAPTVQQVPVFQKGKRLWHRDSWEGSGENEWRSDEAKREWKDLLESFKKLRKLAKNYDTMIASITHRADLDRQVKQARVIFEKYDSDDGVNNLVPYSQRETVKGAIDTAIATYETVLKELAPLFEIAKRRKAAIDGLNEKLGKELALGLSLPEGSRATDTDSTKQIEGKRTLSIKRAKDERERVEEINRKQKAAAEQAERDREAARQKLLSDALARQEEEIAREQEARKERDRERSRADLEAKRKREEALRKRLEAEKQKAEQEAAAKAQIAHAARNHALTVFKASSKRNWNIYKYHKTSGGIPSRVAFVRFGRYGTGELHWHLKENWTYKYDEKDLKIKNVPGFPDEIYLNREDLPDGLAAWVKAEVNGKAAENLKEQG